MVGLNDWYVHCRGPARTQHGFGWLIKLAPFLATGWWYTYPIFFHCMYCIELILGGLAKDLYNGSQGRVNHGNLAVPGTLLRRTALTQRCETHLASSSQRAAGRTAGRRIHVRSGRLERPVGLTSDEPLVGARPMTASAVVARQQKAVADVGQSDQ